MPENEEFQSSFLPDQLWYVSGTLDRLAKETDSLKAIAAENAEALEFGRETRLIAEGRMADLKREYDALLDQFRLSQKAVADLSQKLEIARQQMTTLESGREELDKELGEMSNRINDAEETALLLAEALCSSSDTAVRGHRRRR